MTTIHPTAIVDPAAKLGDGVEIGPYAIVGPGVTLGAGTVVQAHDGRFHYTRKASAGELADAVLLIRCDTSDKQ